MLDGLSLRHKVPLRIGLLVLVVATTVTGSLLVRAFEVFDEDLRLSSANMGRILSRSLTPALLHDDVWRAYEIINTPFDLESTQGALQAETVIVLDPELRVYVSTEPSQYPVLSEVATSSGELAGLTRDLRSDAMLEQRIVVNKPFHRRYVVTPIASDGVLLGTLVMGYSEAIYTERFGVFASRAALTTLLIIAVLLPIAIYWGRRFANPLVDLAQCMSRVGSEAPEALECELDEVRGNDELAYWRQNGSRPSVASPPASPTRSTIRSAECSMPPTPCAVTATSIP
jgi:hypothetical protein